MECKTYVMTVEKHEYEKLVRDSEKLEAVKRFVDSNCGYFTAADILAVLGIKLDKEESEG